MALKDRRPDLDRQLQAIPIPSVYVRVDNAFATLISLLNRSRWPRLALFAGSRFTF